MRYDIITLFPNLLDSFFAESLLAKAAAKKIVSLHTHHLRNFASDAHKTVDDKPYGGGPGMLLKIDVLVRALRSIKRKKRSRVILLSPAGAQFSQKRAQLFAKKYDQLILLCGRYEGFDARIKKYIDEELSIGPYVLNGGEVAAMAMVEATARLIPGVLGNAESLMEESHGTPGFSEYPHYTRPEVFEGAKVTRVLLSGDHAKITAWRKKHARRLPQT